MKFKLIAKTLKKVKAGSILDGDPSNPKMKRIMKLVENNHKLKEKYYQIITKMEKNVENIMKLSSGLAAEDFPDPEPRSNEGKEGFEYNQEILKERLDKAYEALNTRIG